ncbi:MAG: PQQ-binding-like beta-propeller repeat protein [Candidatus Solibacter sp.]
MTYSFRSSQRMMLVALAWVLVPFAVAQDHKKWSDYGGGPDSSHFVNLKQVTPSNVNQLQVAWTYPTQDRTTYLFNPIIVDKVMYVLARNYSLVALDAESGKEIWIHENLTGITTRGIAYWESKDRKDRRLIFAINDYLEEIDASTGKSILTFGSEGLVDLREGLDRDPKLITRIQSNNPGRVFEDLIILGSATGENYFGAPGDIRAYNVITGKMAWSFHTIPRPGEEFYDTWPKDAWKYIGGVNTWGEITIDEKRGIVYLPTGSPTYDYYGADRSGDNLFGNCLLALDARTGKRLWHFQMVHHDLWDYDATAAPQLITVRHEGKLVDAVAESSKQGFLYVFDRVTGKPLWPIEERKVPASTMAGELISLTQPFPTAPPPFARQKMTADDINPYLLTAEERANWKDRIASARNEGLFTPPGLAESLSLPGGRGGSNWGTGAANATKGTVYLTTQDWPTLYRLRLEDPLAARSTNNATQGMEVYRQRCQSCHTLDRGGAGPPALTGINARFTAAEFLNVVRSGRGEMPAFSDLETASITALYGYLGGGGREGRGANAAAGGAARPTPGPVVASGGVAGGKEPRLRSGPRYTPLGGPPYPDGVSAPSVRYYTDWGLFPDKPYIISPPWSSLVAYDLNRGTIKWKVPLGEDAKAAAEGAKNTGAFGAEHHGIIVTSTGLLFVTASDGKLRAYDEETGKVLWTATLPAGSEGIPSMYEVNGRQYLVVLVSSNVNPGGGHTAPGEVVSRPSVNGAYMAFALPRGK